MFNPKSWSDSFFSTLNPLSKLFARFFFLARNKKKQVDTSARLVRVLAHGAEVSAHPAAQAVARGSAVALEEADREEEEEEGEVLSLAALLPSSAVAAAAASPPSKKLVHLRVCLCPSGDDDDGVGGAPEYELQDAHDALVFWDAVRSLGGGGRGGGSSGT